LPEAESPQALEASVRILADPHRPPDERLAAAGELLGTAVGDSLVAAQYRSHRARGIVRALLDSLTTADPRRAAGLSAALLAAVHGEEKLDFQATLLRLAPLSVPPLIRLVRRCTDWQTVLQASDALGKIGSPDAVDALSDRLGDPSSWVRIGVAHALGEIGDVRAVPGLLRALDDTSDVVVAAALVGLGRLGSPDAVSPCASRLSHSNPRVRAAAVSALGRLGGDSVPRMLRPLLRDPDSGVRYKAKRALDAMAKGG